MGRTASVLSLYVLVASLVAPLLAASAGAALGGVTPTATTFTVEIVADRSAAEPGAPLLLTLWVNVTGGGQLQFSRVNVSLDPYLQLRTNDMTYPADCGLVSANASFAEWQCTFLRSGRSYTWSLPVNVSSNATAGRSQTVIAQAAELGGGQPMAGSDTTAVWVLDRLVQLVVYTMPAGPVYPGPVLNFTINATNRVERSNDTNEVRNGTAFNVSLHIELDPALRLGPATKDLDYGPLDLIPEDSLNVTISVIVLETAPDFGFVGINATLSYYDVSDRFIGPDRIRASVQVLALNPLPPEPSTYAAVISFAFAAVLGAVLFVPIVGQRNVVIDEVFLMHRSGILIRHLNRGPDLRKDDDLVASMFVAIQEFVRDSFQTKATLDELSFGGRKAAVLRGRHVVIAALMSRGHPRFLFPQLRAVERALEKAHGDVLEDWDGRVSRLDRVGPILKTLLEGGYRRIPGGRNT